MTFSVLTKEQLGATCHKLKPLATKTSDSYQHYQIPNKNAFESYDIFRQQNNHVAMRLKKPWSRLYTTCHIETHNSSKQGDKKHSKLWPGLVECGETLYMVFCNVTELRNDMASSKMFYRPVESLPDEFSLVTGSSIQLNSINRRALQGFLLIVQISTIHYQNVETNLSEWLIVESAEEMTTF